MYEVRHHDGRGMAATGIGLAAGLGGGALLLGIAGLWGLNQASKARSQSNQNVLNTISQFMLAERSSREGWQLAQTPSIRNYVDVQAGACDPCPQKSFPKSMGTCFIPKGHNEWLR